jgi:hypothetical protein
MGRRVNQQRGLAALDIDGVDEQMAGRRRLRAERRRQLQQSKAADEKSERPQAGTAQLQEAGLDGDSHVPVSVHADHVAGEERPCRIVLSRIGATGRSLV